MIRMAVVGAGSIGMEHIRALEKAEGCPIRLGSVIPR